MRAFIIRPFGVQKDIDFDAVEKVLIAPALEKLGIEGRTTIEILRSGNIRIDMFQRLLTAELVIADLSIHNANVFYELGIRHALCDKRTFLLRCNVDKHPFDLQTDRYLLYEKDNPAASLELLVAALRQTRESEVTDSPVFKSLPDLQLQDRSKFLPVPLDFREEVERAEADKQVGDLRLLAMEAQGFEWESEGLRVVGRAEFELKDYEGARITWEIVREEFDGKDLEANHRLGTIYQRLGDLTRSNQAIQRALDRKGFDRHERAELRSLHASNAKELWKAGWRKVPSAQRPEQALRSPFLEESLDAYEAGFNEDLNHFYSGLNALGMLTVLAELAVALPQVWRERFDTDDDAYRELEQNKERIKKLSAAVELSLKAAQDRLKRENKTDVWTEIGEADLCYLTSKSPARVATAYRQALAAAPDFAIDAVRRQLLLYQELGVLIGNVQKALSVLAPTSDAPVLEKRKRILLFTGHRIDSPDRPKDKARFPAEMEDKARQSLKNAISEELKYGEVAYGIAGGASGGDILFHEVCAEVGIATRLYLALPRDQYVTASVLPAGPKWIERFNQIYDRLSERNEVRVLAESKELPRWLSDKPEYSIWQRNNLWTLHNALAPGNKNVTLIALWDGEKEGEGPGGTVDLIRKAQERGAKPIILSTKEIFAGRSS